MRGILEGFRLRAMLSEIRRSALTLVGRREDFIVFSAAGGEELTWSLLRPSMTTVKLLVLPRSFF